MPGLTAAGAAKLNNHISLSAVYTLPVLSAGLVTGTLNATTNGTEVTGGAGAQYVGYARKAFTIGSWGAITNAPTTSYQLLYGGADIDFGTAGAGSTGCTITGMVIYDAGGLAIWWEPLSVIASTGTHVSFAANQIQTSLTTFGNGGVANTGLSATYASGMLGHMTGKTAFAQPAGVFVALCTTVATGAGIGTEAAYTGYGTTTARPAAGLAAATVAAPSLVVPSAQINFGASTSAETEVAFALMDNTAKGSGAMIAAGTVSSGAITAGLTPDFTTAQQLLSQG